MHGLRSKREIKQYPKIHNDMRNRWLNFYGMNDPQEIHKTNSRILWKVEVDTKKWIGEINDRKLAGTTQKNGETFYVPNLQIQKEKPKKNNGTAWPNEI